MTAERQLHLFRSRRQHGRAPPEPLEFEVHCMVADTLRRWASPNWVWTHIPLGEDRSAVTGARLKRMGANPGWPDFLLIAPRDHAPRWCRRPHFLELKRHGGRLTEAQAGFALWCELNGCPHAVASSYRQAVEVLKGWGALRAGVHVQ
jgi:hypothetical protein